LNGYSNEPTSQSHAFSKYILDFSWVPKYRCASKIKEPFNTSPKSQRGPHSPIQHLGKTSLTCGGYCNPDETVKSRNRQCEWTIKREQHPTIKPLAATSPIVDNTDLSSKQSCSWRAHFRVTVEWLFVFYAQCVRYQSSTYISCSRL
jgi:hypothetical protein